MTSEFLEPLSIVLLHKDKEKIIYEALWQAWDGANPVQALKNAMDVYCVEDKDD